MANSVWIELKKAPAAGGNKGRSEAVANNKTRAALATNMIRRLGSQSEFTFSEEKWVYLFVREGGEFSELSENGHWFNLEFFGRPI